MVRSFFTYMDAATARLLKVYPELTSTFEEGADASESLFSYQFNVPKPSEMLTQMLFRSNLNYLIGSYKALLQTIPSFAYSGMRNVFEGIVRGYYYQCKEEAACASYLYMITHGEETAPSFDDQDVRIMKGVIDHVQDEELKQLCENVIKKQVFTEEERRVISEYDKPSRDIKQNIGKLYTKSVQNDMEAIWSELSRYTHAGFRGRFRDLHLEDDMIPSYGRDLFSLLLLQAGNTIMYLEVIDTTKKDLSFLGKNLALVGHIPKNWPNKEEYNGLFTLTSSEAINKMLGV